MAIRRRKKAIVDEGPFLFTEDEMAGKIENVTVVSSPVKEKEDNTSQQETPEFVNPEPEQSSTAPFDDNRMVDEMAKVIRRMADMTTSHIRLIALSTTMIGQDGLDLNKMYKVPAISNSDITGYELTAWCYCSFMEAFPQMRDKLQMPYSTHYEKAKKI